MNTADYENLKPGDIVSSGRSSMIFIEHLHGIDGEPRKYAKFLVGGHNDNLSTISIPPHKLADQSRVIGISRIVSEWPMMQCDKEGGVP